MKYGNIREEELKNKIAQDFFDKFDCTEIIKDIDFAVRIKGNSLFGEYLLWAEAKKNTADTTSMLTQLVLTIGKARSFDKILPPPFLGCFDCEKIVFIPYFEVQEIFYQNDFNWKITPSNRETKEFKQVFEQIGKISDSKIYIFDFEKDEKELKNFIKENFVIGKSETSKIKIDKNNFINIYNKWLEAVKPTIMLLNWEKAKKAGIIDGDFYLADLLSSENQTLKEKLFVVLKSNKYVLNRHENEMGLLTSTEVDFSDKQRAHTQFWAKYERPPKEEYWDYIIERRDLLVPQDVRERKGSFFTPKIWVELSQKYIADVFGEDWQDEYYVWDCAAGTGNLLAGLTNKYNIWASTLDKADVDVMHERIENGANLLKEHCFQFDFLNDDFDKLPKALQDIINDEKKRKKLIIYINPPYAEAGNIKQRIETGENKTGVAKNKIHDKYHTQLSGANRQLFAQFLIRIYNEIPNCKIGEFSTLKTLSGSHFKEFRDNFKAKLEKMFIVPADSFDNVPGQFPIGFKIWNTEKKEPFKKIKSDVFDKNSNKSSKKGVYSYENSDYFSKWVNSFKLKSGFMLGWLQGITRNDFQNQNGITIRNQKEQIAVPRGITIYYKNFIECCVCFAVRMCISANWLNDCDQFLYPNNKWEKDLEFQSDCLTYTLFNNNISSKFGVNHWIPFTEIEVNARTKFESNFMTDFIKGKVKFENAENDLFGEKKIKNAPLVFSAEAKAVFDAGRELWKYYHEQKNCNVNASFYDIREYFQQRNDKGKMNNKSGDEKYNLLVGNLRAELKVLARKIEPLVFEYGFLRS